MSAAIPSLLQQRMRMTTCTQIHAGRVGITPEPCIAQPNALANGNRDCLGSSPGFCIQKVSQMQHAVVIVHSAMHPQPQVLLLQLLMDLTYITTRLWFYVPTEGNCYGRLGSLFRLGQFPNTQHLHFITGSGFRGVWVVEIYFLRMVIRS